jgi:Tol biopolymer transport system component
MFEMNVSPDGTQMVYHSGSPTSGINEVSLDSGTIHPLRTTTISEHSAAYAPSGDRYIFVSFASGRGEIMLRDVTGSASAQLTFGNPIASTSMFETRAGPVFSPDGRRIAFSQGGQIWTMPATGGQPAPVTPAPEERVGALTWSPDGRWIVYQRGLPGNRELVKIDSAGHGQPAVLAHGAAGNTVAMFTRWSAGRQIAYLGSEGVRICGEDGSGNRLLVAQGSSPNVTGAGAREAVAGDLNRRGDLFYALRRSGEKWMMLTVEVSSGRVLRSVALEESPEAGIRSAWLHPDGKRLLYSRSELNYDIWLLTGFPRPETGFMRLLRHWSRPEGRY